MKVRKGNLQNFRSDGLGVGLEGFSGGRGLVFDGAGGSKSWGFGALGLAGGWVTSGIGGGGEGAASWGFSTGFSILVPLCSRLADLQREHHLKKC